MVDKRRKKPVSYTHLLTPERKEELNKVADKISEMIAQAGY